MAQTWNDTALPWNAWDGNNPPWQDPVMPWNDVSAPWKDTDSGTGKVFLLGSDAARLKGSDGAFLFGNAP